MIRRMDACERFADQIGPDGATTPEARMHLGECPDCRLAVGDLHGLRELLARPSVPQTPDSLTSRLTAIAGEDAGRPLWLAGSHTGTLPSPRARRRRQWTQASTGLLLVCCLLLVAGVLSAPPVPVVDDAAARASLEFDTSAGGSATSTAITAVLAVPADDLAHSVEVQAPQLPPNMDWTPLSRSAVRGLLSQRPQVGFTGVQRVTLGGGPGFAEAEVLLTQLPGEPLQVEVRGRAGRVAASGQVISREAPDVVLPAEVTHFRAAPGGQIAGRATVVVEGHRADGSLRSRWWVDDTLGLVMWAQSFDPDLALVRSAGFTTFTLTSWGRPVGSPAPLHLTLAPARVEQATPAMCSHGFFCAGELAGLRLVEISADSPASPSVVHAVYAHGDVRVSVVMQRGRLAEVTAPCYGVSSERAIRTWQSGTVVYTVTTNGGEGWADRVAAQLPHRESSGTGLAARTRSGLARIVGR